MLYVQSYFDESGNRANDKLISFCGLVATGEQWHTCYVHLRQVLDDLGLTRLKASQLFRYNTPLSSKVPALGIANRVQALSPIIEAIRRCVPLGVAAITDNHAFNEMTDKDRGIFHDDPTNLTFVQAMVATQRCLEKLYSNPDFRVTIVCDDNHKYAAQYLAAFHRVRQIHPEFRKTFVSIGFADDEFFEQLQVADLLAGVARHEFEHRFHAKPFDLRELFILFSKPNAHNDFVPAFVDKDALSALVAARKEESRLRRKKKTSAQRA